MRQLLGTILSLLLTSSAFSKDYIVAIIDTGIDLNHKDFVGRIWKNQGEAGIDKNGMLKSKNGIDDDNNGLIDDINGWNFVDNSSTLNDSSEHGTHIAGIISKYSNMNVKIMSIKYYDKNKKNNTIDSFVKAITYAIDKNVDLINFSGGGKGFSAKELQVLKLALEKKILIVTSAGNFASNSDNEAYYPASYKLSNILSVASANTVGNLDSFSNFGTKTIDIAAQGSNIYSSFPGNKYGYLSGTSQATALVTAFALNLLTTYKSNDSVFLKERVIKEAEQTNKLSSFIRNNSYVSLAFMDTKISKLEGSLASNKLIK